VVFKGGEIGRNATAFSTLESNHLMHFRLNG